MREVRHLKRAGFVFLSPERVSLFNFSFSGLPLSLSIFLSVSLFFSLSRVLSICVYLYIAIGES